MENLQLQLNTNTETINKTTMTEKINNQEVQTESTQKGSYVFLNTSKITQEYSVYKYTESINTEYKKTNDLNNLIAKVETLIEMLKSLKILEELLMELLDKKSKINKDNASEMMESLLGNLNMNNKFQYMEMNTEVEMSAQEFTEIMDHMNSKEQYKNLSQEEKMYKIMETANYVGTGGLLDIQC
mgnify:CR=1 FL=1|jgi:hypothetical protein